MSVQWLVCCYIHTYKYPYSTPKPAKKSKLQETKPYFWAIACEFLALWWNVYIGISLERSLLSVMPWISRTHESSERHEIAKTINIVPPWAPSLCMYTALCGWGRSRHLCGLVVRLSSPPPCAKPHEVWSMVHGLWRSTILDWGRMLCFRGRFGGAFHLSHRRSLRRRLRLGEKSTCTSWHPFLRILIPRRTVTFDFSRAPETHYCRYPHPKISNSNSWGWVPELNRIIPWYCTLLKTRNAHKTRLCVGQGSICLFSSFKSPTQTRMWWKYKEIKHSQIQTIK